MTKYWYYMINKGWKKSDHDNEDGIRERYVIFYNFRQFFIILY